MTQTLRELAEKARLRWVHIPMSTRFNAFADLYPEAAAFIHDANPSTILSLLDEIDRLREACGSAAAQIRYLHDKLGFETGSGNAELARLDALRSPSP